MTPAEVEDRVPEESEVTQEVRGIKGGRSGGLSGMRLEYLQVWLRKSSRENNPVKHWWWILVRLVQRMFKDGVVSEEVLW